MQSRVYVDPRKMTARSRLLHVFAISLEPNVAIRDGAAQGSKFNNGV